MKTFEKFLAMLCVMMLFVSQFTGCSKQEQKEDNKNIVIWTSGEDYKNEYYLSECQKQFPDYNITLEYMNSSSIAAKVVEEGENCSCDIILSEEYRISIFPALIP